LGPGGGRGTAESPARNLLDGPRGAQDNRAMKVTHLHACRVRIPQKPPIAPYQNRYRAGTFKEALLVRLETDTGLVGWGETPDDWINRSFEGTPEDLL